MNADPDPGVKINADPDPQPCQAGYRILTKPEIRSNTQQAIEIDPRNLRNTTRKF